MTKFGGDKCCVDVFDHAPDITFSFILLLLFFGKTFMGQISPKFCDVFFFTPDLWPFGFPFALLPEMTNFPLTFCKTAILEPFKGYLSIFIHFLLQFFLLHSLFRMKQAAFWNGVIRTSASHSCVLSQVPFNSPCPLTNVVLKVSCLLLCTLTTFVLYRYLSSRSVTFSPLSLCLIDITFLCHNDIHIFSLNVDRDLNALCKSNPPNYKPNVYQCPFIIQLEIF